MDKVFTVSLCNPDKDVYVTLAVPAGPWMVLDAWQQLRPWTCRRSPTPYWMCGSGFGPPRVPKWNGR